VGGRGGGWVGWAGRQEATGSVANHAPGSCQFLAVGGKKDPHQRRRRRWRGGAEWGLQFGRRESQHPGFPRGPPPPPPQRVPDRKNKYKRLQNVAVKERTVPANPNPEQSKESLNKRCLPLSSTQSDVKERERRGLFV